MKFTILSAFLFIFFTACSVTKRSSSIKMADGNPYYEQDSPYVNIQLLGDYFFQPLKTKYFRDIDKGFIKYATSRSGSSKPSILYTAHTIIQPYYSSVCLQYRTKLPDTAFLNSIKSQLHTRLKVKIPKMEIARCGVKNAYKLTYHTTHPLTQVVISHTEYFCRAGEFIYRLLFWTTNSDDSAISTDAEYIIKEMRFD